MYAIEFNCVSRDGVIYIPMEYKEELGNRENIRLVVMYEDTKKDNSDYADRHKEVAYLEKLFKNSNNKIKLTRDLAINTDGMMDDIS